MDLWDLENHAKNGTGGTYVNLRKSCPQGGKIRTPFGNCQILNIQEIEGGMYQVVYRATQKQLEKLIVKFRKASIAAGLPITKPKVLYVQISDGCGGGSKPLFELPPNGGGGGGSNFNFMKEKR